MNTHIESFRAAIQAAGIEPPDAIEADGKLRRFASNGKRSDDAGWYTFHDDGVPAGAFGCWRTGINGTWSAKPDKQQTPAERQAISKRAAEARAAAEAERAKAAANAAVRAREIWNSAKPAEDSHAYLTRKGVKAHGLRIYCGPLAMRKMPLNGCLIVPARGTDGQIYTLEFIHPDSRDGDNKRALFDGDRIGHYYAIGKPDGSLCICEGFATGASIYQATGRAVAVAFHAGNLEAVARALRAKYPDLPLIVCADDDNRTAGNPGITKATETARAVGALLAIPNFGENRPERATDFNDLARHAGADVVRRCIDAAAKPAEASQCDAGTAQAGAWPEILPLPSGLPEVEAFDVALMPDALRGWISDIAERTQCPADFAAVGALVALGSVVGRRVAVRPKARDEWDEHANLWGVIIGAPGVLKSAALAEALRPLHRIEAKAREAHQATLTAWIAEREAARIRKDAARFNARKAAQKGNDFDAVALVGTDDDAEPAARRYIVNDCSVEALGEVLRANPNGVLAYRDEMVGLLKSLEREGMEGARAFFLSAYTGKESHTFDRIGRGLNLRVDACCLSLLGSIQPAVIGRYLREAVENSGDDGLLSRFSLMVWPDVRGEWRDVDRWADSDARRLANETFERLADFDPAAIGATAEEGRQPYLRLTDEAREVFIEWRREFERAQRDPDEHPALVAHFGKYRKTVPALALIFHLADEMAGAIGTDALLRALAWVKYLESHARRAYASVQQAEAEGARALLKRIRRNELPDPFTVRDVYRSGWAHVNSAARARHAVEQLAEHGYLIIDRIDAGPRGGHPAELCRVNPGALV